MGRIHALELSAAALREELSLIQAIETHLTCNHYPPVAKPWHAIAIDIVKKAKAGKLDWDAEIVNPLNGRSMTVHEVVEGLHLDCFMEGG